MKIKTSELINAPLDYVVAKCEGYDVKLWYTYRFLGTPKQEIVDRGVAIYAPDDEFEQLTYCPSSDWAQGGPIIQQENMTLMFDEDGQTYSAYVSLFRQRGMSNRTRWSNGSTPLIAAMRCLVASKLGEYVDVPDELINVTQR